MNFWFPLQSTHCQTIKGNDHGHGKAIATNVGIENGN